jgi:hypothetical protein
MNSSVPSLYEPINRYKPLAPDIGVVDGPFEYVTMASDGSLCRSPRA